MKQLCYDSVRYNDICREYAVATTVMENKSRYFETDIYFRESAFILHQLLLENTVDVLDAHSYILLKPDGVAARALERLVECLNGNGFIVKGAKRVCFTRHSIRELWRYELNRATLQRLNAIDILLTAHHGILLLVEDVRREKKSGSSRLKSIKGPVIKKERVETEIRHAIDAGHGLLNFVHTPDETADLIRELAILLPQADLVTLFNERTTPWHYSTSIADELYSGSTPNDIDVEKSVSRLLRCRESLSHDDANQLEQDVTALRSGGQFDWRYIWEAFKDGSIEVDQWDVIVVLAAATQCNIDGVEALLKYSVKP